ncbi:MAG: WYL domain-containing protein [Anaerolineae bacterium]|nr:WYL domain-containing protein [Anaerolineae bacterium]
MRADRLLSLMMLLQTRGKMSARALAKELEVTERTIYRDIEALEMAGVPIYAEPGRDGGYGLIDRYRTSLTGLSEGEVRALFMLSIPTPLAELGVNQELKAALLKLTAALPATRRGDEVRVRDRFYLDAVGWEHDGSPTPHLHIIHQAVWQDRRVTVKYRPLFSVELEQTIDPYGLVVKAGEWYLVFAYRDRIRVWRVSEFMDVRLTEESFTRPSDFALEAFWKAWCVERAERHQQFYVRARIAPEARAWLAFYLGSRSQDALAHAGPPDAEGWFILDLTFDTLETARARLLPLGGAVEVLEPDTLRLSLADFAEQTLRVYRP